MNDYKYPNADADKNGIVRLSDGAYISHDIDNPSWLEYQQYLADGGQVDPFRTRDEWEQNALSLLKNYHNYLIIDSMDDKVSESNRKTKLTKALRKESKGTQNASDIKILDDNDLIDTWNDDMETAMESNDHGEQWIEDPIRTEQELIDYDPSLVSWPDYPII